MYFDVWSKSNPLLEIFNKVREGRIRDIEGFLEDHPEVENMRNYLTEHLIRRWAVRKYAWAVPTPDVIHHICNVAYKLNGIVEAHAGSGYWSHLIKDSSNETFEVIATDINPWDSSEENSFGRVKELFMPVKKMDANDAAKLAAVRGYALLSVWPNYGEEWTGKMVETYIQSGGRCFVFVGEQEGGCTGNDYMFYLLEKYFTSDRPEYSQAEGSFYGPARWDGIHDTYTVYKRNDVKYEEDTAAKYKLEKENEYGIF